MQQKNVHWFPGHMVKAMREIEARIKVIDVIIELLDARAPISSRNAFLYQVSKNKKRLIILTKDDLADPQMTKAWQNFFEKQGFAVLDLDITRQNTRKIIENKLLILGQDKKEKDARRGIKPQPIRIMIAGIPNVGKSTLINQLAGRKAASVENKPGHTRAQQWIKVGSDFELLDTPGILPANYDEKQYAMNLALLGSIRSDILPQSEMGENLLQYLKVQYPHSLKLYDIEDLTLLDDVHDALKLIGTRRGYLKSGEIDLIRSEQQLLQDFKDGKLGRLSLEVPNENTTL